ncbi:MAG: GreA/GreB family elongation factor [Mariprofundaceae bacterium]
MTSDQPMNKATVLSLIIKQLQTDLAISEQAVSIARDTATHTDCSGSSRYETMGLEASYLAQGQGIRLLEVERSLAYFKQLVLPEYSHSIGLSSLIQLRAEQGETLLWLAADAGGLKVQYHESTVTVITPKSPLGHALLRKNIGEFIEIKIAGKAHDYEIKAIL